MLHMKPYSEFSKYKFPAVFLAFFWISGLILGTAYAFAAIDFFSSLMRAVVINRVSIFGLAANLSFLFLVFLFTFYQLPPMFSYMVVMAKAFIHGYCLIGIDLYYGTAGWLINFFLAFSESFTIIPFLWFSFRCIHGRYSKIVRDFSVCFVCCIAVWVIDYFLVSPYFVRLITIC